MSRHEDDPITERQHERMRLNRARAKAMKDAGDDEIDDGSETEERKAWNKLQRDPYAFPTAKDEYVEEEILRNSGCRQVGDQI